MGDGTATHYVSRHGGAGVSRLALLGAASPRPTERPDSLAGLDDEDLDPLMGGGARRPGEDERGVRRRLFHSGPSEEYARWLRSIGMSASPRATAVSAETFRDEPDKLTGELDSFAGR